MVIRLTPPPIAPIEATISNDCLLETNLRRVELSKAPKKAPPGTIALVIPLSVYESIFILN